MSALIEGFKKEHVEIIEALKEVKKLGVHTEEGQAKLMSEIVDLLKHLWSEDQWFYPVLLKASKHNKKLEEILSVFTNGLGGIHEEMTNFITKYSKGVRDNNFQRDYERLFNALDKRIEYEEEILFGEYEKLNS
jgi:hypothetical protein